VKGFCKEFGVNLLSSCRRRLQNLNSAAPAQVNHFHAAASRKEISATPLHFKTNVDIALQGPEMIHLHGTQAVGFRVLIVASDTIERMIFARCVEMLGWTAETASSLDDAAAKFATHPHHVAMIDLRMEPRECAILLHSLSRDRIDLAVIFASGSGDRAQTTALEVAREMGLRVAGILPRPVDPYRLHGLLLAGSTHHCREPRGNLPYPTARELEDALRAEEIHAEYQPKTDLITGEIVGVEALARWHSQTLGCIPPSHFVPVAEQSDLIGKLTLRVLEDAVSACAKWRRVRPDYSVSVNISPFVLSDPGLLPTVDTILARNKLPPKALIAEITETALLTSLPAATDVLHRLTMKGVRVSMDGFGTGHASLQSLLRMPFTELKIDRSHVGVCRTDPEAWKLVRATVSMARELGLSVVAEGVETEDVSDRLRDVGCDMGQGWYFGRPMQDDAMLRWLMSNGQSGRLQRALMVTQLMTGEPDQAVAAE
jgi:EAL domain-containing protein (putative c-di-GMP-specific phosphodiesterase class I)